MLYSDIPSIFPVLYPKHGMNDKCHQTRLFQKVTFLKSSCRPGNKTMSSLNVMQLLRPVMRSVMASQHQRTVVSRLMSSSPQYEYIKTSTAGTEGRVGLVTLNRPKALNALCAGLMDELIRALNDMDNDPNIGAMVVTGSEKVNIEKSIM